MATLPGLLPGESHGRRGPPVTVGGVAESDSTLRLCVHFHFLLLGDHTACASAFELGSRAWQLQLPERGLPRALLRSQRSLHPATGGQPLLPETGAEPAEQQGPTAAKKQMSK